MLESDSRLDAALMPVITAGEHLKHNIHETQH